jgi:hypothetical protein
LGLLNWIELNNRPCYFGGIKTFDHLLSFRGAFGLVRPFMFKLGRNLLFGGPLCGVMVDRVTNNGRFFFIRTGATLHSLFSYSKSITVIVHPFTLLCSFALQGTKSNSLHIHLHLLPPNQWEDSCCSWLSFEFFQDHSITSNSHYFKRCSCAGLLNWIELNNCPCCYLGRN